MALRKLKPTSAGQRFTVRVVTEGLHKGGPHEPLTATLSKTGGRNNQGRITTRHRGGGHKRHYRIVDFRRNKDGITGRVERLEYDPNRSAHLALILYTDGERRYILAPKRVRVGDPIQSGSDARDVRAIDLDGDFNVDFVGVDWAMGTFAVAWYRSSGGSSPGFTKIIVPSTVTEPQAVDRLVCGGSRST